MSRAVDRPVEIASFANLEPEDKFAITQTAQGPDHVVARQQLPRGEGRLAAGWLGVLADFATGRAVQAVVGPEVAFRTLDLRIDLGVTGLRSGTELTAIGEVVDSGAGALLATARIDDDNGGFVANVTTRFVVVGEMPPTREIDSNWSVPQTDSLSDFLGASILERFSDRLGMTAPAAEWMRNPYGIVHGGVSVALADVGLDRAVTEAAGPVRLLSVDVMFQRPALIGAVPLIVDVTVDRVGGRVVTATAIVYQESTARPVAIATGTFLRVTQ